MFFCQEYSNINWEYWKSVKHFRMNKAARKMLVKLTPIVNFTNIL